jgi:type IV secretion system protein VirD4
MDARSSCALGERRMRILVAIGLAAFFSMASLGLATAFIAGVFSYQRALGAPLLVWNGAPLYPPWSVLAWARAYAPTYPKPFAVARAIVVAGGCLGFLCLTLAFRARFALKRFGADAWARRKDVADAGLLADRGVVLGVFEGEMLAFDGPEHQLLIGASRSGKGRGHVVPTLLAWGQSALVLDIKGELADGDSRFDFPGAAGFRETLGPVLRFAPTRMDSAAFNPLFEVRRGLNEVRDVQNIVEILIDPQTQTARHDFWDRSAQTILVGVILHVLYAEPLERKTLAVVRESLRDLDRTAETMKRTLHRLNPASGRPQVHPEVLHAAESYLAGEERLKSGIKATAESYFGLFGDEIVAANTATSQFRIGDLMCGPRPVTLFLQPPPSDATRLMPLLRLFINQVARALMEDLAKDAQGRRKQHRLLLVLDEFPALGRMTFFETMMGAMAGYGLKAFLVCQSLNHITKAYGRHNVILDNCHVVTTFAATDSETAEKIAAMAGEVWELRESQTSRRPRPLLGWGHASTTLREERRPLISPGEVRALARDEELIFVSGAKPIRAKKLKFDREPVFRKRLLPAANTPPTLSREHDWIAVRALGVLAPPITRPKTAQPKPAQHSARRPQAELFPEAAEAAPAASSLAAQARSGFVDESGAALPHPSETQQAKTPLRATGV